MTKFIRAFIILLVFISAIELSAQRIFPVQVRPSIRVGSVFLADYEDPSNFMVQVRLNDLNYPVLHTRLKITIQKDDKIIKSKEGIQLDLIGGQTIILSAGDLKDLFNSEDLDLNKFSGSGNNVRTLPEGTYRFSFKASEVKSGQTVSDSTTDFTWATITVNDPPLLNLPGNLSEIEIRPGSQNIFFSWTPRGLPALPGTQLKYKMRMVQVDPPDRNPYEAMNTGALAIRDPIFQNLDYTTFIYDQSLFNLLPGAVYAWQIEAYELINENGTMVPSSQRFRNNGFSEVYSFKVKENCPEIITEKPITDTVSPGAPLIVLRWNRDLENHKAYEVKYRPAGTVLPWTIAQTLTNELKLGSLDLEKGKQYEYTVAAKCNSWQTAVYGGMFMLPASECEAPEPVEIVSNDVKGIKLSWDKVPSADSYLIHYKYSLSNDSIVTKNISEPEYLLPPVPAGFYTVKIDALCSGKTGEGKQLKINYKDTELSTDCPLPNPVRLTAQTAALSAGKKVDVTWNSLPVHAGYELKYHHRDSTIQYSYTSTTPGLKNIPAATGQIYQYQLTYTCKSGKTVTAPPGWFRAEGEEDTVVRIKPGTASCFPPAFTMAEPKSKTSARIEWEKVKGADEYQVFYALHGSTDFKLFTTTSSDARITELTASEKYDYKIKCRCGGEFSIFSKTGLLDMGISADGTCDSAKYFKVARVTEKEIQLTWKYEPSHTGYKIQWKELSQPWDQKYTENLSNIDDLKASKMTGDSIKYTIENLNAGTTYQFKLQVICQGKLAVINGPLSGDTKSEKEDKKDCSSPNACDRSVTKLKTTLNTGDTVQVADYKMVISKVKSTGQDKWSGEADAEAPFIGLNEHIRLKTTFTDLVVNEKSCALGGKISIDSTTFQALDDSTRNKIKNFVAEVDKYTDIAKSGLAALDSADKYGNTALNYYQGGGNQGKAKTGNLNPQITSDKSLTADKIKVGSGGEIMIDGVSTGQYAPALIKDKDGQVFSVGKDNQPILAGKYDPTYQKLDSLDLNRKVYPVDFIANSKAKYAFDKFRKTYGERPAMSPHYLKRGDTYFSAKAIVPSEVDYVDFKIKDNSLNRSDLKFVNREGFVFETDGNTITVVGGPSSDAQEVFAVTDKNGKREIVGALLLASYEPVLKKVVIIPIQLKDGLQKKISKITEQLNDVYGKVGITYTIEEDTSFRTNSDWCETPDCKFKPTGSALLSNNYTGDEKNVRDAYISFKGPDNLEKDAAYIFAIGSPITNTGDEELQGKMRFEEQFGFLYNVSRMNEETLGKILAHELGHGNYLLYHTFEKMYLGDGSKNTTFNVMDYGMKGDSLNKMQWDIVHQPGVNWGIFNRDGDQLVQQNSFWVKLLKAELTATINTDEDLVYGILNHEPKTLQNIVIEYGKDLLISHINKMDDDEIEFMKYELNTAGIELAPSEINFTVNKNEMTSNNSGNSASLETEITYSIPNSFESYHWFILNDVTTTYEYNQNNFPDRNYRSETTAGNSLSIITAINGIHKIICRAAKGNNITYFEKYQQVESTGTTTLKNKTTRGLNTSSPTTTASSNGPLPYDGEPNGTKIGFVVSGLTPKKRKITAPYDVLSPASNLERGKEIIIKKTLVEAEGENGRVLVTYKNETNEYCTATSNLTEIKAIDDKKYYWLEKNIKPFIMPYSTVKGESMAKKTIIRINKECGLYYHIRIEQGDKYIDKGWVLKSDISNAPLDLKSNFEWMTNVNISGSTISAQELATILENRAKVNDRTLSSVYSSIADRLITYEDGYYYPGKNLSEPTIEGTTDFETQVMKLVYEELKREGGFSSMNSYDDEGFTWGKGLAATGGSLTTVIQSLMNITSPNIGQVFKNIGIKINSGKLSVLKEDGTWATDNTSSASTLYASNYIKSNTRLQSFFIELAEKEEYRDEVATEMWKEVQKHAGKIPNYVYAENKTKYASNWSDASVSALAHFSHWLSPKSWEKFDYSSTNGKLEKIIYKFTYNTIKAYSNNSTQNKPNPRIEILETNIYRWNPGYKILDKFHDFGQPQSVAEAKINEIWTSHVIGLTYMMDKNNKKRAVKNDTEKYISNSNCIIIKKDSDFLILTEDAENITLTEFEKPE